MVRLKKIKKVYIIYFVLVSVVFIFSYILSTKMDSKNIIENMDENKIKEFFQYVEYKNRIIMMLLSISISSSVLLLKELLKNK
ncbi:hypothetical protein ABGF49_05640 [Helcococcus ovis]|uniref:Uncharacterized protein n=2 Tax=Helcococcus ovis TaxID=72026 RepID=A0A4R9C2W5_9FIRM|nr:hypothetical protein [Helcococcus ovis]TFF63909.1 hypothetical protein EQF92_07890 [Helcococcus ovis]TFF67015.1 hypothetical protein EQF91_02500 [Helcococcus ovis]